eukprot:m.286183 g.286183  ORF g.286183 m.286183 type:complete len:90 (+) comp27047_c0_seq4:232-501(+)
MCVQAEVVVLVLSTTSYSASTPAATERWSVLPKVGRFARGRVLSSSAPQSESEMQLPGNRGGTSLRRKRSARGERAGAAYAGFNVVGTS